ncbi:MAG: hypothetical protein ABIO83_08650, partial [Ilumatobacteraceae bacterium]
DFDPSFDPAGTPPSGAYGPVAPGRKVEVLDGAVTVFSGYVDDYDYEWRQGDAPGVTLLPTDALATLGRSEFLEWTTDPYDRAGERITKALDRVEVAFPTGGAARAISTGLTPLQSDLVTYGSNVLNYLQLVANSDMGRLFVDRAGVLTYTDRYALLGATSSADFDDTETNLPFHAVDALYGTEQLYFQVSVGRLGGEPRTFKNTVAIAAYPVLGIRQLAIDNLLVDSDAYAEAMASELVDRYSVNSATVSSLTVKISTLEDADRATVAALDIGDLIGLTWTPTQTSTPVVQDLVIEGVTYRSDLVNGEAFMDFQLSAAPDLSTVFVLDTDSLDGTKVLGF